MALRGLPMRYLARHTPDTGQPWSSPSSALPRTFSSHGAFRPRRVISHAHPLLVHFSAVSQGMEASDCFVDITSSVSSSRTCPGFSGRGISLVLPSCTLPLLGPLSGFQPLQHPLGFAMDLFLAGPHLHQTKAGVPPAFGPDALGNALGKQIGPGGRLASQGCKL